MKRYPRLILILMALTTIVCRCSMPFEGTTLLGFTDKGQFGECEGKNVIDETPPPDAQVDNFVYECSIPCPDGTTVHTDLWVPSINGFYDRSKYCTTGPTSTPTSTTTPVPPTSTPVPLLSGDVTECSLSTGFINFRLAQGAPSFTSDQLTVTINGAPASCSVTASNTTILTCSLPAGVTFPADVSVALNGSIVNHFTYSGDVCFYVAPTPTKRPEVTKPSPTPTPQ